MSRMRFLTTGAVLSSLVFPAAAQQPSTGSTLDAVRQRGAVQCGVSTGVAGFSRPDSQGKWEGLDVDICRAVAAAVFGDSTKVRYVALTAQQRFTALQSGEIDILSRNTTWTFQRDVQLGLDFTGINFYDGQGFMVRKSLGVKSAKELNDATVCVQPGTTTEVNLADWFRTNQLKFTPVVIENYEQLNEAYLSGRCDAYTTDVSGLAAIRFSQGPQAADHVILPEVISKEPLSTAVRQGDARWSDIVRWTFLATLEAEDLGISSKNIDEAAAKSDNPAYQRFVGATGELGKMLGVDDKWAYLIVKQVGNYGEIFDRNITPLGIPRGLNRLWKDSGLMYSPPIR